MTEIILLFLFALIPGLIVIQRKSLGKPQFKFLLTFSGAYLLTLICSHLLPEIFSHSPNPDAVGLWIVIGLFGQMILESFSLGVEHGHMHAHEHLKNSGSLFSGVTFLLALSLHALIEGTMLIQSMEMSNGWAGYGLLAGILVHKVPAAIALTMVMKTNSSKTKILVFLLVFSIMSPIGLFLGQSLNHEYLLSINHLQVLYGLASGSLLYISLTIIFEAREDHGFRFKETFPAILGALVALTMSWGMG
jgi:zinc and cadmium transporter